MTTTCRDNEQGFGDKVRAFLSMSAQISGSVRNLTTRLASVGAESKLPVSINASEPDNTWICSPYTAYGRYSIEEIRRWDRPLLTGPLILLCRSLGAYLQTRRIDDSVALNNWLLSTNLYPQLDHSLLRLWIEEALGRWPNHALWFRSLNETYTPDWLRALAAAGFILIPSRQVYLYDRIGPKSDQPDNLRWDLALLGRTPLQRSPAKQWAPNDFARAARLYEQLYMEKYSRLNPHYTEEFLRQWHSAGLFELTGFRDPDGTLQAVVGLFAIDGTVTAPIVGYATERSQREGLYRLLMAEVYQRAVDHGWRINLSAGAAQFKRLRGGKAAIEYSAVYVRHLPKARRRAILLLSALARHIGAPCMRRFEL